MRCLLLVVAATACTSSSSQTLTGRVAPGFPSQPTTIKVERGATTVATAPIASDGSFTLSVPPGTGYTLRAVGTDHAGVVFPRHALGGSTIARSFSIHGGGVPFDFGTVRYVGAATTTTFVFHDAATSSECVDGHDATGATCVDDGDASSGTCAGGDGESEADDDTGEQEGSGSGSGASDDGADDGDAVADHNFPADGCADGDDNGGDD